MDYITIDKKKYPFWFANKANREMSKCEELTEKDEVYFFWLAFKYGSISEGKDFPYTEDGLLDIIEVDRELFTKCGKLFGEQMGKLKAAKAPFMEVMLN